MTIIAFTALLASSCAGGTFTQVAPDVNTGLNSSADLVTISGGVTTTTEPFENGSKTSYAAASVALETGSWTLDDALIGTSTSDRKNGTKAVRLQQTGKATMLFNLTNGASTVTVKHAVYGSDGTSTWELWKSANSGSTWTKVGSTVTTSSTTLASASFTVNQTGTIRFEIRKISGGTYRLNIDDIAVTDYTTSGGGSGGTLSEHITLGNPSGAITDTGSYSNYLLVKSQYAMSYSRDEGKPNWVAWHLDSSWIGSAARQDDFRADTTLPSGWYQVGASSYSGSGFDRGHYCPSADRTSSVAVNSSTFLMSNMMPQAPDNNQGPWARLEDYERSLVDAGNELYIYAGSYGSGGTGSNGSATTVDSGRVKVPNRVWKVIVVLPTGSSDASRVTTSTRVIAVNLPNAQGIRSVNWGTYRVTVNSIESATGFDLLSEVPTSVQSVIEAAVDTGPTS
ncbi:MAG: DNA/RNA non-specific endonuclease [Mesorhizobium sp.]